MRKQGPIELVEIEFPGSTPEFRPAISIEPCPVETDHFADFEAGRLAGPADLAAAIAMEKLRGNLTDLVYSMGSGRTDFYPHQFKPVLQFVKSTIGRILIADEVGLGKTIEAIYIWKELQVRDQARRLLVVCPSMLRVKWQRELEHAFGIAADIVDAKGLVTALERARKNPSSAFALIASLEGLRPPKDFDAKAGPRSDLAQLLEANRASDDHGLLDLVIIDEAHYLRNRETSNNRLGRLLRDASRRLVLLTATPIQIHADNLFQLLHLIDEEEFQNADAFDIHRHANQDIVAALRFLRKTPADPEQAAAALSAALRSFLFSGDEALVALVEELKGATSLSLDRQVAAADIVESRSLLARHMTRSRKREVLERRVERSSYPLKVTFSDLEKETYARISQAVRAQASASWDGSGAGFALLMRQRQMASSMAAAIGAWAETDFLEDLLWEDRGWMAADLGLDETLDAPDPPAVDLAALEAEDSKYAKLKEAVQAELTADPAAKIVVFAFFKPTLRYLLRRLEADGISALLLTGGMGDDKDRHLERFAEPDGPHVLLSSEVASEGVDLQFARVLVNYDLPWNPMRVEQRIGRLDRLGQKADKITILNLYVGDSVEERILHRLYDRIEIFRTSVGDLEEILGEASERLMTEIMDPSLTDDQRLAVAEQQLKALEQRILNSRKLEEEAQHLLGLGDFVLDRITEKKDRGDFIRPQDVHGFLVDALRRRFPVSRIESDAIRDGFFRLILCEDARRSLHEFLNDCEPDARGWGLADPQKAYVCDPELARLTGRGGNLIDAGHPVVRWLRRELEQEGAAPHAVVAVRVAAAPLGLARGSYSFVVESRFLGGVMKEGEIDTCVVPLDGATPLFGVEATNLRLAAERGERTELDRAALREAAAAARLAQDLVGERAGERYVAFEAENDRLCDQREITARRFADRKLAELQHRIAEYRSDPARARIIPALEGQIRGLQVELSEKLERVRRARHVDASTRTIAVGVVIAE